MGKRRKSLLKLKGKSSVEPKIIPITPLDGLPPYSRFFDTTNGVRFFFENALNRSESIKEHNPSIKQFLYSGNNNINSPDSFFPKAKKVLGSFAIFLARQVIHYTNIKSGSQPVLSQFNIALVDFVSFMETVNTKPSSFKEITQDTLVSFGNYLILKKRPIESLGSIKRLFLENPEIDKEAIKQVFIKNFKDQDSDKVNFEEQFEKSLNQGYSNKELIQILAYVYYDLDKMLTTVTRIEKIKNQGLEKNKVPHRIMNSANDKLISLFKSGHDGFDILIDNILSDQINTLNKNRYYNKLRKKAYSLGLEDEFKQFSHYIRKDSWAYKSKVIHEKNLTQEQLNPMRFVEHLNGTTSQYTFCIIIYVMVTTGINYSVLASWKRKTNGKLWFENFDKFLGNDEDAPSRDRSVLIVGIKKKTGVMPSKKVPTAIPIHSPLFKYLKAYDSAHDPNRESFLAVNTVGLDKLLLKFFLEINPIYSDKNELLTTIKPKFFRKVFAGHKLLSLLGDVKSADELVYKLKEALNHASFDTTLFSYIMKAGVGNQILDSAIVALTSDLLEKSLKFSGQIKADDEKTKNSISVFLCDCSDPSNPTHGLPINNDHCRKYDMCLGCERAEVYAEHIPNICYRILQHEEMRENNGDIYKISMEDRHVIALDTLKKFEFQHSNGIDILASGYALANESFANNKPLLPPILQMEKL